METAHGMGGEMGVSHGLYRVVEGYLTDEGHFQDTTTGPINMSTFILL